MDSKDETIYALQDALVQTLGDLTLLQIKMKDDPEISEMMARIKAVVLESGYDRSKR